MKMLPVLLLIYLSLNLSAEIPQKAEIEEVFEEIEIVFKFKSKKPTFGDLFLIVGYPNPNFPSHNNQFDNLKNLGFSQIDDYFGIPNNSHNGSDTIIWLFPQINDEVVHHNVGPFDSIKLEYNILRNVVQSETILKSVFESFRNNLDVDITLNDELVTNYSQIEKKIHNIIEHYRKELELEPGSNEALKFNY